MLFPIAHKDGLTDTKHEGEFIDMFVYCVTAHSLGHAACFDMAETSYAAAVTTPSSATGSWDNNCAPGGVIVGTHVAAGNRGRLRVWGEASAYVTGTVYPGHPLVFGNGVTYLTGATTDASTFATNKAQEDIIAVLRTSASYDAESAATLRKVFMRGL